MGHASVRVEPLEPRRLFSAGEPDPTFFNRLSEPVGPGRSDVSFGPSHEVVDLDVSSIGQVYVTRSIYFGRRDLPNGALDTDSFTLVMHRLHPDGTRDERFQFSLPISPTVFHSGEDGGTLQPRIHTHVLPDDSLLVHVGNLIYKYLPNGRRDASFGTRGRMIARQFIAQSVQDVTMDQQGRVLVIGAAIVGDALRQTRIARLATNGRPDMTFSSDDSFALLAPFPGGRGPRDMVAQTAPDGSMVLGGIAEGSLPAEGDTKSHDIDLVKLTPDGRIDTTYGQDGIVHEEEASTDLVTPDAHDAGILVDGTFYYTREARDRDLGQSTYETRTYDPSGLVHGETSYNAMSLARDAGLRVTVTDNDYLLEQASNGQFDRTEVLFRDDISNVVDLTARSETQAIFGESITPLKVAFQPDGSVLVLASDAEPPSEQPLPAPVLSVFRLQRDESPAGLLDARSLVTPRDASYRFRIYWRDEDGVDVASLGDDDVSIVFPDGVRRRARLVGSTEIGGNNVVLASYLVTSPDARWDADDNGHYDIRVERKSVRDTLGNPAGRRVIGGFVVQIAEARPAAFIPTGATLPEPILDPADPLRREWDDLLA